MPVVAKELGAYFAFICVTMFFGLPIGPATLLAAKVAPAWAVASIGVAAALINGVLDYGLVRHMLRMSALQKLLAHRYYKQFQRAASVAPFLTTVVFAGFPLPFILVRAMMPATGYPMPRYLIALAIGRFCRLYCIATFGTFIEIPTNWLVAMLVGGLALSGVVRLVKWRLDKRKPATPISA